MNEEQVVVQLINELDAATAPGVEVRTVGGDNEVEPPDVIFDWTKTRIEDANGHKPIGGYLTDGSGNKTGVEHHTYWAFEGVCTARSYSEQERDQFIREIEDAFIPYEASPKQFNSDTREWEVQNNGPSENSVIEPDWYEAEIVLGFEFVRRTDETGRDHIETIDESVEVNESLEITTMETK